MADPIQLVPNRPDAELAAEIEAKVITAYESILPVLDEAAKNGFIVQAAVAMGPFGKFIIQNIQIMKVFK